MKRLTFSYKSDTLNCRSFVGVEKLNDNFKNARWYRHFQTNKFFRRLEK